MPVPTVLFAAAELPWDDTGSGEPLRDNIVRAFGELVGAAARPIDDVRGSAAYRRHALSVLARRTLGWAWHSVQQEVST
jgi:CO/xanthine dehydrogenase FAD-binding subunit